MFWFKDLNIICFLVVCIIEDLFCMIMEYMENGDFNQFFFCYEFLSFCFSDVIVSYVNLKFMVIQIVFGMKYFLFFNFVY